MDLAIPVMLLTARDSVEDRVHGLDVGADDYLVKPFALPELLARCRALLRREFRKAGQAEVGDLALDAAAGRFPAAANHRTDRARVRSARVSFAQPGTPWSPARCWRATFGRRPRAPRPIDNVIDVHIARLRRKLDDGFDRKLLHTVRGVGFILREDGRVIAIDRRHIRVRLTRGLWPCWLRPRLIFGRGLFLPPSGSARAAGATRDSGCGDRGRACCSSPRTGGSILRDDYHNHPESKRVLERLVEVRSPDGSDPLPQ